MGKKEGNPKDNKGKDKAKDFKSNDKLDGSALGK